MTDLFATLADPTRRALLEALRDARGPLDVPMLAGLVGSTRQSVNRHLVVLKEAALVTELGDGPERTYAVRAEPLLEVENWLASFLLESRGPGAGIGHAIGSRAHGVLSLLRRLARRP